MNHSIHGVAFSTEIDGVMLTISVSAEAIRQWGLHPADDEGIRIRACAVAQQVVQGESLAGYERWDVAITASRQVLLQPSGSLN